MKGFHGDGLDGAPECVQRLQRVYFRVRADGLGQVLLDDWGREGAWPRSEGG